MRQVEVNAATGTSDMLPWRKRKPCTTPTPPVPPVAHLDLPYTKRYNGFDLENLPREIVTRIVCTRLAISMTERVCETASTICALRSTSRKMRTLTDGFVGLTLGQLMQRVTGLVRTGSSKAVTMLDVSAELRSLGITPLMMLELRSMGLVTPSVEAVIEYPLLETISAIPSWQHYLVIRKRLEKTVASEDRLVNSNESPSQVYKRFKKNGDRARPEHDRALANGSVSPSLSATVMVERVGV